MYQKNAKKSLKKHKIEHSPTLNTIRMVETALKNSDYSVVKVHQLKKMLPRKVNHNTLMSILEYLDESNKIIVGIKGITWIHNSSRKLQKEIDKAVEIDPETLRKFIRKVNKKN